MVYLLVFRILAKAPSLSGEKLTFSGITSFLTLAKRHKRPPPDSLPYHEKGVRHLG
jgi:hypothetical protein